MSVSKYGLSIFSSILLVTVAKAGPFPPAAGQAGSTALAATDPSIVGWASGYENHVIGANVDIEWQDPQRALFTAGDSNNDGNVAAEDYIFDIVALGQGGQITLTFDTPIRNGDGFDFAIFENAFTDGFLELAKVAVSSNGNDFVPFPTASLTPASVGPFAGTMNADDIDGLAGKYVGSYGTPFDLGDLSTNPLLDLNSITHVRIIDVVGDGSTFDDLTAPDGPNPIYDPYQTFGSAGFDLDAVAVMYFQEPEIQLNVPLPTVYLAVLAALIFITHRRVTTKHSIT